MSNASEKRGVAVAASLSQREYRLLESIRLADGRLSVSETVREIIRETAVRRGLTRPSQPSSNAHA